jgi:hypothetical protein
MNLYIKNGNRTHDTLMLWTGKKSLFSNLAVSLWLKGVNLKPNIVPEWESNPRNLFKCEIENLSKVSKEDSNPWLCCKVDSKQYKCSNLGIEPMSHVLWDKILVYLLLSKIFLIFLYLGDGFCPLWGCYYCLLWSCSLFIWAP